MIDTPYYTLLLFYDEKLEFLPFGILRASLAGSSLSRPLLWFTLRYTTQVAKDQITYEQTKRNAQERTENKVDEARGTNKQADKRLHSSTLSLLPSCSLHRFLHNQSIYVCMYVFMYVLSMYLSIIFLNLEHQ